MFLKIENMIIIKIILALVEKLSNKDLLTLCDLLTGEILARKGRNENSRI